MWLKKMWGLSIIIGMIGIIVLFIYLAMKLPKEYFPIKLLLWLCTPILISIGLFICYKLAYAGFTSTTSDILETLFVVWIRFLILFYIYFAGMGIVKLAKKFRDKKYIERLGKI